MINRVKELRQIVPIPMGEALTLLRENDGDVEKCVYLFKAKSIRDICDQTGCDTDMANRYYETEKYDVNRAISFIRDEIYDRNYKPIEGVTAEGIRLVRQWIALMQEKDFAYSLDFIHLEKVIEILTLIPELSIFAKLLHDAKTAKDEIFEGYTDNLPMKEFVRHHKRLDDSAPFELANRSMPMRITIINEILLRHLRNLAK